MNFNPLIRGEVLRSYKPELLTYYPVLQFLDKVDLTWEFDRELMDEWCDFFERKDVPYVVVKTDDRNAVMWKIDNIAAFGEDYEPPPKGFLPEGRENVWKA